MPPCVSYNKLKFWHVSFLHLTWLRNTTEEAVLAQQWMPSFSAQSFSVVWGALIRRIFLRLFMENLSRQELLVSARRLITEGIPHLGWSAKSWMKMENWSKQWFTGIYVLASILKKIGIHLFLVFPLNFSCLCDEHISVPQTLRRIRGFRFVTEAASEAMAHVPLDSARGKGREHCQLERISGCAHDKWSDQVGDKLQIMNYEGIFSRPKLKSKESELVFSFLIPLKLISTHHHTSFFHVLKKS